MNSNTEAKSGAVEAHMVHTARELTILYRFTEHLFRAQSLQQIYDAALDAICAALGCSRASILLFDTAGVMRFVASRGLSEGYRVAVDGHSPWGREDRDAAPIYVGNARDADESDELKATILKEGIEALAFIPLASAHALIGKFMVYYDTPHVFTDREHDLALTIGRQLGFAVERNIAEHTSRRLAALVDSSDDAIIGTDVNGIITDWNGGAERLFGYRSEEVIGRSVMLLVPADRQDEEPTILARIRSGERVEHYETLRRRKDGTLVDISLTVSPIRDHADEILGASKIARDISDRRRVQEQRELMLREMDHRVKNAFALTGSLVGLSAKSAATPAELVANVTERLAALARAHAFTMSPGSHDLARDDRPTALHALIGTILAPYGSADGAGPRFSIVGFDPTIPAELVTPLCLLLHEFATNATKHGSLAAAQGTVQILCSKQEEGVGIRWRELGGPEVRKPEYQGFGSRLVNASARQLGRLTTTWDPHGVVIDLIIDHDKLGD
ncbi:MULTISPECIES: PAS domain S-box protein [unclassified Chelatococcus]|uniref:PAS domain S-box protein n=1 Tax=unclassified Chelatococcus TaxID=2638111 RepID=UPI001BCF17D1|nr:MULTISPECIES: PAS domain S-box protein [unclassified Chelatococcus]MBS7697442.1 PAS domain S-box protein [Chelatococcus sp. YT9]MBX3559247.1 PAS domain S-box protein [Chelatococcus sp.]